MGADGGRGVGRVRNGSGGGGTEWGMRGGAELG